MQADLPVPAQMGNAREKSKIVKKDHRVGIVGVNGQTEQQPFHQEWASSLPSVNTAASIKTPTSTSFPLLFLGSPQQSAVAQPAPLSPCPNLLSHPTLGLRCTRISSSSVRVARQGTELSSGLRAFVLQAGDSSSSREEEESKVEKSKGKKKERNAQAIAQASELGDSVQTFTVISASFCIVQ